MPLQDFAKTIVTLELDPALEYGLRREADEEGRPYEEIVHQHIEALLRAHVRDVKAVVRIPSDANRKEIICELLPSRTETEHQRLHTLLYSGCSDDGEALARWCKEDQEVAACVQTVKAIDFDATLASASRRINQLSRFRTEEIEKTEMIPMGPGHFVGKTTILRPIV
ncbi:hypothetical protein A2635_03775 [Candidatus Peribacteria bacterium RIFCSPHIGHO2_01_FULL_51_9]|nr:MAG: hypothetical protein A2635_03775 [Candidatus Peribacteria bacterium RIFCSPHIGHO2_01_FULL_51_9]